MKLLVALALGILAQPSITVRDINGVEREPLKVEKGHAAALFFITQDCPISNYYSHEIRRICDDYAHKGLACTLVYVDPTLTDEKAREHFKEYGHRAYPAVVDRTHALVRATGAEITPTAVVITRGESIAYRGRIDNFYAGLGKPHRVVTQHDLRDALDAVFVGRPVVNPEEPPVGCYIPDLKAFGK